MNTQPLNQHTPHLVLNNKHNVDCLCQNPKLKTKMQNNQSNVKCALDQLWLGIID